MEGYIVYSKYGEQTHIFRRIFDESIDSGNLKSEIVYTSKEEAEKYTDKFFNLVARVNFVNRYSTIFGEL